MTDVDHRFYHDNEDLIERVAELLDEVEVADLMIRFWRDKSYTTHHVVQSDPLEPYCGANVDLDCNNDYFKFRVPGVLEGTVHPWCDKCRNALAREIHAALGSDETRESMADVDHHSRHDDEELIERVAEFVDEVEIAWLMIRAWEPERYADRHVVQSRPLEPYCGASADLDSNNDFFEREVTLVLEDYNGRWCDDCRNVLAREIHAGWGGGEA